MQIAMNQMKNYIIWYSCKIRDICWHYIFFTTDRISGSNRVALDYIVGNVPLRQRETVLLGVTDKVVGLVIWQATINANLDTVRNIVDYIDTVLGPRRGDSDVWSTTSIYAPLGFCS